jgi:hypothetical protein
MNSSKLQLYPLMVAGVLVILLVIVARLSEGTSRPMPTEQQAVPAESGDGGEAVAGDEAAVEGEREPEPGSEQDLASTPISPYPGIRPFRYLAKGRRDPFIPLLNKRPDTGAMSLAQLELTGILWNRDESLAVLEDRTGKGYPLRIGDRIGNATLTGIKDGAERFTCIL